jgi:hypothetical protein
VENTGTRPSSSVTSAELVAPIVHGIPQPRGGRQNPRVRSGRGAIVNEVFTRRRLMPALPALMAALAPWLALPAPSPAAVRRPALSSAAERALLHSRELWATIDVCSPADQPDYVGIRGSMPGDRRARDKMYMSFRLQYLQSHTKKWADLSSASPSWVLVGPGSGVRQGGRSFQLVPRSPHEAFTLRGVVEFQWRRGTSVLQSTSRTTSAGHTSLAGADPVGYTSASCRIG